MKRNLQHVPYGYEPPREGAKGTLIYYDTFAETSEEDLNRALKMMKERAFAKLVLYPLHEETVKRMTKQHTGAFYKREKPLLAWCEELGTPNIVVESWEGKRKKYTPVEAALRHLTEKYSAPHFVYMSPEMANTFASYASFEEWIVKLRLILTSEPEIIHPRLEKHGGRWSADDQA